MKQLYINGGPMGVGKTTVCRELKALTAPCAFLDGDWCWDMEPFQVTPETHGNGPGEYRLSAGAVSPLLRLRDSDFCWVLHQQEIVDNLLPAASLGGGAGPRVSLLARPETLKERIGKDVAAGCAPGTCWSGPCSGCLCMKACPPKSCGGRSDAPAGRSKAGGSGAGAVRREKGRSRQLERPFLYMELLRQQGVQIGKQLHAALENSL